jgi:MFS family permease
MSFVLGAFSGRLLDAGYFLPVVIVGVTLQVLGIFLMSISTKYWQLILTQGLLNGIGSGIFFTPCMGIMAQWFSKRRSIALGIASTGNSAGSMIYPIIVQQLLPKLGFAWTTRVLGFLNLGLLILVILFMKPRLPPRKSGPIIDFAAFKEPPYSLFCLGIFFQVWTIYYALYYISSFAVEAIGLPFSSATNFLIIINGVGIPARLIPGLIADKYGPLNTVLPISWTLIITTWCWIAVRSSGGLYAWVVVYGMNVSALQCLIPPICASLTKDMRMIGTRLGMIFSLMGFAGLSGPPIGGAIQQAMGGRYLGAQIWAASASLICAIVLTIARMANKRINGKESAVPDETPG